MQATPRPAARPLTFLTMSGHSRRLRIHSTWPCGHTISRLHAESPDQCIGAVSGVFCSPSALNADTRRTYPIILLCSTIEGVSISMEDCTTASEAHCSISLSLTSLSPLLQLLLLPIYRLDNNSIADPHGLRLLENQFFNTIETEIHLDCYANNDPLLVRPIIV